jgi:hypothetical protein
VTAAALSGDSEALPGWRDPAAAARTADIVAILTAASLPRLTSLANIFSAVWLTMLVPTPEPEALPSALRQPVPALPIASWLFARPPRSPSSSGKARPSCSGTWIGSRGTIVSTAKRTFRPRYIVASLFNSHLFDFHEGRIFAIGVGVAGGMLLQSRSAEVRRGTGRHDPGMNAGTHGADELSAGRCALKNPPAACSRSIT